MGKVFQDRKANMAEKNYDRMVVEASVEVLSDSVQVHQTLPTSTGIKGSQFKEVQPLQNIGRQGSTFHITVDKDHLLDPYCTFVYIESILKDGDGDNLATGGPPADGDINNESKVIPVNGLPHAWFNNVIVKINGTVIQSINNKYAYRGDLDMRLSFSKEIKMGHLRMCGLDEEIVAFEDVDAGDLQWWKVVTNEGVMRNHSLMRRFRTSCNSKVICMIRCIH